MSGRVLLAVNCQDARLYAHRYHLAAMYAGRFPEMLFLVPAGCEPDPSFRNIVVRWTPGAPSPPRTCWCADPDRPSPHARDVHFRHPHIAALAPEVAGYDAVLFIDTDVILSPALTPSGLLDRLAAGGHRAVMPRIYPGDPAVWKWVEHETGGVSLARMAGYLDDARLWRHWCAYQGRPATDPPPEGPIVLGAWSDYLLIEARLLKQIARDLVAFQAVFHEIAVPTVLLHATARVGVARGAVWWGADRQRPLEARLAALETPGAEFCHPIKFGTHGEELVRQYLALAPRR